MLCGFVDITPKTALHRHICIVTMEIYRDITWHWNGLFCADVPLRNCSLSGYNVTKNCVDWTKIITIATSLERSQPNFTAIVYSRRATHWKLAKIGRVHSGAIALEWISSKNRNHFRQIGSLVLVLFRVLNVRSTVLISPTFLDTHSHWWLPIKLLLLLWHF